MLACMVFGVGACVTTKRNVPHEFPMEMSSTVKQEYIKLYDKGQILYHMNCASCHNKKVKGREVLPDFSPDQLKGYELRVLNPQHEMGLLEESITAE